MPSPISFETPVNLVVEATAKDELGVQISFGQRISKKDNPFRRAEHIGAVFPELAKNGRSEVFEVCRRNYQWWILFP